MMQSDATVVSLVAFFFFKKIAIIIAILGEKILYWQLSKVHSKVHTFWYVQL